MNDKKSFRQLKAIAENSLSKPVFTFALPAHTRGVLKENGDLDITKRNGDVLEHLGFFMEFIDADADDYDDADEADDNDYNFYLPYHPGSVGFKYVFIYNKDFSDTETAIINPHPERAKDVREFAVKMGNLFFFNDDYMKTGYYKRDKRFHDRRLSEIDTPLSAFGFKVLD